MAKLITCATLSKRLQCCERTITRAASDGTLTPCSTSPLIFNEETVTSFLNKHKLGMARKLFELPTDLFTTLQVANALGVKPHVVRRWVQAFVENQMPHFRLSKTWVLFRMDDVNNWLKQQTAKIEKEKEKRSQKAKKAKDYYKNLRELKKGKK